MSKMTLLEMTQEILSAMDSDEVDSISDTVESMQVANLLRGVYYDLVNDLNLPEHYTLFELNASGNPLQPTLMTVPDNVMKLEDVHYNYKLTADTNSNYQLLEFINLEDFMMRQGSLRNSTTSTVGQMTFTNATGESFEVMYQNDKMPQFFTSFDDHTILFDSYDANEDTTLQKSKTQCTGKILPTFTMTDAFIPMMDATQFRYYVNKAKVRAFNELKQQINQEAIAEARRQKVVSQNRMRTVPDRPMIEKLPRYGRTRQWPSGTLRPKAMRGW